MDHSEQPAQEQQSLITDLRYLLRCSRQAAHPGKLYLATVALLLTFVLGSALDWMWLFSGGGISYDELMSSPLILERSEIVGETGFGVFDTQFAHLKHCLDQSLKAARKLQFTGGMGDISNRLHRRGGIGLYPTAGDGYGVLAFLIMIRDGFMWTLRTHWFFTLLYGALLLVLWSVCGGSISRITALQFVRDEHVTVRDSLVFSRSNVRALILSPLAPVLVTLVAGMALVIGGWLMGGPDLYLFRIPLVGPVVGGALFFLALIAGVVIAISVLGTVVGFALMWPAVAVEGMDCTDAIGRSFTYLGARPERAACYALFAILYGAFVWLVIRLFAFVMLYATHGFVCIGLPQLNEMWSTPTFDTLYHMPELPEAPAPAVDDVEAGNTATAAEADSAEKAESTSPVLPWDMRYISRYLVALWVGLFCFLLYGYLISYFFTGSTIVYYLLRFHVDETELDDVYLGPPEEDQPEDPAMVPVPPAPEAPDAPPEEAADDKPKTKKKTTRKKTTKKRTKKDPDQDDNTDTQNN